jgi:hypothetical protein
VRRRSRARHFGVGDLTDFTPGLSYATTLDRMSLRGIGRLTNNYGSDPGIATYSDGFYTREQRRSRQTLDSHRAHRSAARPAGHAVRPQLDRRRAERDLQAPDRYPGGYQGYTYTQESDFDGTSRVDPYTATVGTGCDSRTFTIFPQVRAFYQEDKEYHSNEINLISTNDGPFQWILGLYQYHEQVYQFAGVNAPNQPQLDNPRAASRAGNFAEGRTGYTEPEYINSYEFGVKQTIAERLTANLSLFYYDYEDAQYPSTVRDPVSNINQTRFFNLEAATSFGFGDQIGQRIDGERLPSTPQNKVALNANYTWHTPAGNLTVSGTWTYRDETYYSVFNRDHNLAPSYTETDMRLLWNEPNDRYTIIAYGKNVFDRKAMKRPARRCRPGACRRVIGRRFHLYRSKVAEALSTSARQKARRLPASRAGAAAGTRRADTDCAQGFAQCQPVLSCGTIKRIAVPHRSSYHRT